MGTVTRRQPRKPIEVRRQEVLDAALRLISERGYGAATMEAIAREANLAKPVVYKAYPGRGALLQALLEREERLGLAAVADALSGLDGDIETWLVQAVSRFLSAVRDHPVSWRLMLLGAEETPEEVRRHVEAGREFALDRIKLALRTTPRPDRFDLELAARSLLALGEQAAKLVLAEPDEFTPERYARFARQILSSNLHRALIGL
jgi:AcrR family transcriptional regulator